MKPAPLKDKKVMFNLGDGRVETLLYPESVRAAAEWLKRKKMEAEDKGERMSFQMIHEAFEDVMK